jgi:hypothetical protein
VVFESITAIIKRLDDDKRKVKDMNDKLTLQLKDLKGTLRDTDNAL